MVSEFCTQRLHELSSLVHFHETSMMVFCILNLVFFRVSSCGKSFSYLHAVEMLIDTHHYQEVFPESCLVGSCSGNVRTINVWCYHRGDVEHEIERRR